MQQIIGRVTADATVKTLDSGKQVVSFSVADNKSYKPKGQEEAVQVSTFFNCSYWLSTAVAPVLRKGAVVQLNGQVSARAYSSNTGDLAASLNFHTDRIEVLAYAAKNESTATSKTGKEAKEKKTGKANDHNGENDDLPF